MAVAETARLIASLDLKGNFDARIRASEKALGGFDLKLDQTQSRAYRAGQQIGTGIKRTATLAAGAIGFLAANVGLGLRALTELESIVSQTNAVLKSTKGVAGQTAESVRNLAEKYEALNATIDDKVIQSAENVLLTFTAVRKEAFEPAIRAALDMSTALGTDLQGSVIQIGKALQDPIKGITALRRVGVNFSVDQIKVIKRLVETGRTLDAQKLILKELNTEFGGSFLAGGNTTAGKVAKFKDSIEDLQKALATALLPTIGKVADGLTKLLADPAVQKGVTDLGQSIASLFSDDNLRTGADFLKGAFQTAKEAAPIVAGAAKATFTMVQAAVGLFKQLPAPLQGLLVGGFALNKLTGGLVTNIAGGIADLIGKSRGATPANPVFVADVGGGIGGAAGAAGGGSVLSKLGGLITKLAGLALVGGGLAGIGAGVSTGGPAGAGIAALSGAGVIAGGALLAGPVGAIIGAIAATGKTLLDIRDASKHQGDDIANSIKSEIAGGASLDDLQKSLAAANTGINDIQANPINVLLSGDALDQLRAQRDLLQTQISLTRANATGPQSPEDRDNASQTRLNRGGERDIAEFVDNSKHLFSNLAMHVGKIDSEFRGALHAITGAKTGKDIAAAVKKAVELVVTRGRGGVSQTKALIAGLKAQLANTHDPKLAATIRTALRQVEAKLPNRIYAAQQVQRADKIFHSSESLGKKIRDLQGIERDLKDHKLPGQSRAIQAKINALKHASVIASAATTAAVIAKKLAVSVTVPVTNRVVVNSRDVFDGQKHSSKYFVTVS